MILTTDEKLIRSILEDESVIDGFNDGKIIETLPDELYFYEEGVGLFPCNIQGKLISIHAAIPKKNRGIKAVKAARSLIKTLAAGGYDVWATISYNRKNVELFALLAGLSYVKSSEEYKIYRYM